MAGTARRGARARRHRFLRRRHPGRARCQVVVLARRPPTRRRADLLDVLGVPPGAVRPRGRARAAANWTRSGPELVVASPGFRPRHPLVAWALAHGVPVWGDVELAWRLRDKTGTAAPWLAVTGTNGKTTTVQLLAAMLSRRRASGSPPAATSGSPSSTPSATRRATTCSPWSCPASSCTGTDIDRPARRACASTSRTTTSTGTARRRPTGPRRRRSTGTRWRRASTTRRRRHPDAWWRTPTWWKAAGPSASTSASPRRARSAWSTASSAIGPSTRTTGVPRWN